MYIYLIFRLILTIALVALVVWGIFYIVTQKRKPVSGQHYYCIDCQKSFSESESKMTQVGIYPCPYCASSNTVLDTLEDKKLLSKEKN
jgi:hypothetical protein